MSLRERRIISAMTPEAKRDLAKAQSEGRDPITGQKPVEHKAACPACEVKSKKDKADGAHHEGGAA